MGNQHITSTSRRRATGIARTVIIAASSLAFVLVAYAFYQYFQLAPEQAEDAIRPFAGVLDPPTLDMNAESVGVGSQRIPIGSGKRATFTLYPRQGTRAIGEIEAENWEPIDDLGRRLRLIAPEVRAETRDGRRINVRAEEAVVETPEPGGFDPQRGHLTGSVVIEIDRLTLAQREALPEEERDRFGDDRVIRVDLESLEFDLEFMRVSVAGPFTVHAEEMDFRAADLEVRFDTSASRIDLLKTQGGGRLELRGLEDEVALSLTGPPPVSEKKSTLSRIIASARGQAAEAPPTQAPADVPRRPRRPYIDAEGALVLVPYESNAAGSHEPIIYEASFTTDVAITQETADGPSGRIAADVLRIIRAVTQKDRDAASARRAGGDAGAEDGTAPSSAGHRVVMTWAGELSIEAAEGQAGQEPVDDRLQIVASGQPVHVWGRQGKAQCAELHYDSMNSHVRFDGTRAAPAELAGESHGTIIAVAIESRQSGDVQHISAVGPGRLLSGSTASDASGAGRSTPDGGIGAGADIEFADRLEATMRQVSRRGIGLRAGESALALETARLRGAVVMRQDEGMIRADQVDLTFDPSVGRTAIKRLEGQGQVSMAHGADGASAITCDNIEVHFENGASSPAPKHATARGSVTAVHLERTIQASDRMEFVFRKSWRAPGGTELLEDFNAALDRNVDPNKIDLNARLAHSNDASPAIELASLQAFGQVSVRDASSDLSANADRLACTLSDGNTINTAELQGVGGNPAHFQSGTFAITGDHLVINVDKLEVDVPGPGRMAMQLRKDLDGRPVDKPVPVVIDWRSRMKFRGSENRAVFEGKIHAVSEQTWFDCGRLEIEFIDVVPPTPTARDQLLGAARRLVDTAAGRSSSSSSNALDVNKEPTYFLATGDVVAEMSSVDPASQRLKNRVQIKGPVLSVNLRDAMSMMRIEGPGTLLIEDLADPNTPPGGGSPAGPATGGLGAALISGGGSGDSTTAILWQTLMYYDANAERAQFEGNAELIHLSGIFLEDALGPPRSAGQEGSGQKVELTSSILAVEFDTGGGTATRSGGRPVGSMSARTLKQFRATNSVQMSYERHDGRQFWLRSEELTYHRIRELLFIQGGAKQPAAFTTQNPGAPPRPYSASTLTVDLATERVDAINPTFSGP